MERKRVLRILFCLLAWFGLVMGCGACGRGGGEQLLRQEERDKGKGAGDEAEEKKELKDKSEPKGNMESKEKSEPEENMEPKEERQSERKSESEEKQENRGIYYEKLNREVVRGKYDSEEEYAYSPLCLRNQVYTGSDVLSWQCGTEEMVEMEEYVAECLGEGIGKVYGNHEQFWSDVESELQEVTESADVYEMEGCDSEVRVCIFYRAFWEGEGEKYVARVFDCLNGIRLEYGRELFQERLNMDRLHIVYEDTAGPGERWSKKEVEAWKEKLYRGKFIKDDDITARLIQDEERFIWITDGKNAALEFQLGTEGKVAFYLGGSRFLLKMD